LLTAGIVTAAAFLIYQQIENHVLNPVIMSRAANVNPLLVLLSLLAGTSIGDWVGGFFGSFVGPCWPSRPRAPCRSSPGNCGRPPRPQ
jgi:predicted PurR-regulated permease PerM